MASRIINADVLTALPQLPDGSINCCVTSPPYFGLRDYGHDGQIGLEQTPDEYVSKLVQVFREVRRVLCDDGTLWLNLGDSYARAGWWSDNSGLDGVARGESGRAKSNMSGIGSISQSLPRGLKSKDLVGIPWRVAFALQADGWWLRQDIIWHKPNPMPESVTDRCTKAHEYLFLLAKSERYYYDHKALLEPFADERQGNPNGGGAYSVGSGRNDSGALKTGVWNQDGTAIGRNRRSVWTIPTQPYSGAHFATFPPSLVEPCILAGCPDGGTVLDPFCGSGTTLAVAEKHGRHGIGIELNPDYIPLIEKRLAEARTLFTDHTIRPPALSTEAGGFFTGP